ncbi:MAG: alpha-glucosidase/alpha-galactosidase [Eubacteriales bacterium]|nr:alpha-glucosidase/alpha-galactosidase [Eubacteriales bacterium]
METNKAKNLTIAYIGGGSRGWAWSLMSDLALDEQLGGVVRLYDIDQDAAEKNVKIGNMISAKDEAISKWSYEKKDSLRDALAGVDFIIISILPGTFEEMESDVHAAEAYGVYQSVGDTTGPGGLMRSLRTIPMYVEIAQAIKHYAPNAWVINYTNPMAMCVKTLYEVFPEIKAFGCCHEVFGTQRLLCSVLKEVMGVEDVSREDIIVNVMGVNHFTWLDKASWRGVDLFPLYREFIARYGQNGYCEGKPDNWRESGFASADRVKMDLFERYGIMAAAGDRHLAEFMPPWYLKDPKTVHQWCFGLTTVTWRKEELKERLAKAQRLVTGEEQIQLKKSNEEGHLLIRAILGLGNMVSNVNLPNRGQIENLPWGAIVETNALFSKDSVQPIHAGSLPPQIQILVAPHAVKQQTIYEAAVQCDPKKAFSVFASDPLMACVDVKDAEKLFKKMLIAQKKYLPSDWERAMEG